MSATPDRELFAAAQRGQPGAFATLIGHYRDVHTRFAVRMLGGYEAADEALLAAFVRAFQTLSKCKEPEQFGDWLFRLVINECRARALRRAVRERRPTGEVAAILAAAPPRPDDAIAMQRVIEQVDPTLREPFILLYVEELPYQRIATLTGVNVQTLERQVDRACARLRALLPTAHEQPKPPAPDTPMLSSTPVPSLAVRVAMPLQRPEVLNDSFEDRLMSKLLRPGAADGATNGDSPDTPMVSSVSAMVARRSGPQLAPPPVTDGLHVASLRTYLALAGVAAGLVVAAFVAGYGARRWRDIRDVERRRPLKPVVTTKIVRRTDTVRVVRADTIVLARFAFADDAAHSVALVGDFNDWNAAATALEPAMSKGSWSTTLALAPGRYEYAFLVDGKRWVTDRFARGRHEELGVESSVLQLAGGVPKARSASARARLRKVLPDAIAERVTAKLGAATDRGLPTGTIEQRALELAARHVAPKDIEHAVAVTIDRFGRARQLLGVAGRMQPGDAEVVAAAEVLRRGGDSTSVVTLAKVVPARRSAAVPLQVAAALVGNAMPAADAVERVATRVHNEATDEALAQWGDETVVRLTSRALEKTRMAKSTKKGTTEVRQAGSPKPAREPAQSKPKSSGSSGRP